MQAAASSTPAAPAKPQQPATPLTDAEVEAAAAKSLPAPQLSVAQRLAIGKKQQAALSGKKGFVRKAGVLTDDPALLKLLCSIDEQFAASEAKKAAETTERERKEAAREETKKRKAAGSAGQAQVQAGDQAARRPRGPPVGYETHVCSPGWRERRLHNHSSWFAGCTGSRCQGQ
jgi:hypothetical protein